MYRLTNRMDDGTVYIVSETGTEGVGHFTTQRRLQEVISRLAYYEDLEEQGRLLVLPSAIGGTVYRITAIECENCPHYDGKTDLDKWTCDEDRCPQQIVEDKFDMWMLKSVGRLIFETRAEAEVALAKEG